MDRMTVEAGEEKKMPTFAEGWTPQGKTYLEIFLHMLPLQWFTDVFVVKTSEGLENASHPPVSFGEMLRYVGLWLLMATCSGWRKEQFWSDMPYDQEEKPCPYRFNDYMSKRRFDGNVLAFVLALCEVNSYLALKYFVFAGVMDVMPTLLVFRRKLAWQLIKNRWVVDLETNDTNLVEARTHKLMTAPHFALRYHNRRWYLDAKSKYQQFFCKGGCGKRRRTYCACNPGYWLCVDCHGEHIVKILNPPAND